MLTKLLVLTALVPAALLVPVAPAQADPQEVRVVATLDGRDTRSIDDNAPLRLDPDVATTVAVRVTNAGRAAIQVRRVRLQARTLGLTLFSYTTPVGLDVAPGETAETSFSLDLADLGGQATGLLPAQLTVLDADRDVLAGQPLVVDVRGSVRSVYGAFALGLAALTAALLLALITRLLAGRLPDRRLSRAWRFAVPGLGLGLTACFPLSALRIAVPSASLSTAVLLLGGVSGFVAGFLTPGRTDNELRDIAFREDIVAEEPLLVG